MHHGSEFCTSKAIFLRKLLVYWHCQDPPKGTQWIKLSSAFIKLAQFCHESQQLTPLTTTCSPKPFRRPNATCKQMENLFWTQNPNMI